MSPQERRVMLLGVRLHKLNTARQLRQQSVEAAATWRWPTPPAWLAGALMGTAQLDEQRRQLRALLADQIAQLNYRPRHG